MKVEYLIAEIGSTTTVVTAFNFSNGVEVVGQGKGFTSVLEGDVTIGLRNAIKEIEDSLGEYLEYGRMIATSSAAGGLKITVHGLVEDMTVKAAREAALGAGGIIKNVTAGRLRRTDLKKIKAINPNLIMIAGGTDYGERETALDNAELISAADFNIPVVYCGNIANQDEIKEIFEDKELYVIDNVYPKVDELNVEPARAIIQDAFEKNIVRAGGMDKIKEMVDGAIMPTPGAVMEATKLLYEMLGDVMVLDVGGATTDVHSVTDGSIEVLDILITPEPKAKRTVEGDIGVYVNRENVISLLNDYELEGKTREEIEGYIKPIPATEEERHWSRVLTQKAVNVAVDRHVGYIKRVFGSGRKFSAYGKDLSMVKYIVGTGGALTRLGEGEELLEAIKDVKGDITMRPTKEAKVLIDNMYIMACAGVLSRENKKAAAELLKASLGLN
ncbi:MAG: GlmL-related ornithine degradation protein [Clostridium sp.]|uniref:GlmL-related ornithine degradation protein n=1 Tax=Clostridium culturomicium TaxID=1499683 RepID=UPI00058D2C64|nr:GlmL-related ornithine degradation protein [Clostridium culturomicium]MDU4890721.1 GlmL-related ornithine degradation protein [Clostridium sp.]MDU7082317.1 GlmL-related ornithine degradation protein [Clostridium sp.]